MGVEFPTVFCLGRVMYVPTQISVGRDSDLVIPLRAVCMQIRLTALKALLRRDMTGMGWATVTRTALKCRQLDKDYGDNRPEVAPSVFSFLTEGELSRVAQVCKQWNLRSEDAFLWKSLYLGHKIRPPWIATVSVCL